MILEALTGQLTFTTLAPCDLSNTNKREIREYFLNSYDLNESLFVSLKDESVLKCSPDRLRLPLVFYYTHTAVVYMNKLVLSGLCQPEERVDIDFEALFETGVDEQSWDDTENFRLGGAFKWPSLKECVNYRQKVKDLILRVIERTPLELPVTADSSWWALFMGMEHERIHLETSSVLIRQLPIGLVEKPERWSYAPLDAPVKPNPYIAIENTSMVELGKPADFPSYGWDNEYGKWKTEVPPFKATKNMISNAEFLKFVESGGYSKREYWTTEGWSWKEYRGAAHPSFWYCQQGCTAGCGGALGGHSHCTGENTSTDSAQKYRFRLMFDIVDLPLSWPAEVNFHEAKAYCNWLGPIYRLPVEAEQHVMRGQHSVLTKSVSCDVAYDVNCDFNLHFKFGSSTPIGMFPESDLGFTDLFGNVWEYVEDHFNGFPESTTHAHYDDYSSPTFDGKHATLVGGSWISTGASEASRFGRFGFRHHFFQHAGFRVACSVDKKSFLPVRFVTSNAGMNSRNPEALDICLPTRDLRPGFIPSSSQQIRDDNENTVNKLIGDELDIPNGSNFSVICADVAKDLIQAKHVQGSEQGKLLVIGVGAGRTIRELSQEKFTTVLAIDVLGCLVKEASNRYEAFKETHPQSMDVSFKQLTWLPNEIMGYDTIIFTSMENKANAEAWLLRIPEILQPQGTAILTSATGIWSCDEIGKVFNDRIIARPGRPRSA